MSAGIFKAAQPIKNAAINLAVTEIIRMANPRLVFVAIYPARTGAMAAPLFSIKYWIENAVLRTSGSAISFIEETIFGLPIGIKRAVMPSIIPKMNGCSVGIDKVIQRKIAPIRAAAMETSILPRGVLLKAASPSIPPTK